MRHIKDKKTRLICKETRKYFIHKGHPAKQNKHWYLKCIQLGAEMLMLTFQRINFSFLLYTLNVERQMLFTNIHRFLQGKGRSSSVALQRDRTFA